MTTAATLAGSYFDGRQPIGSAATLLLGARTASLVGERVHLRLETAKLKVSPRVARAPRFIDLPDGGQFQCADSPLLDGLPQVSRSEGIVAWLEARVAVAVAGIALIITLLATGYLYGLPAAADRAIAHIPIETEQGLGKDIVAWMDDSTWFQPSHIDTEHQTRLREAFDNLLDGLRFAPYYRLEFRNAPIIGANAFALPGGTIIVTDGMIEKAESDEEVLAVLAHEIGHVEHRHTLRHLVQNSIIAVTAATITADAASLSVAVAGTPALMAQMHYSREFESEADEFGFALLKQHSYSPAAFASLMGRLSEGSKKYEQRFGFLSSHPASDERIQRALEAAAE